MLNGRLRLPLRALSAAPSVSSFAVVFDVDGVLVKGKTVLPGAVSTLHTLRDLSVPFMFMTNGGGTLEAAKAESLSKQLRVQVQPEQVCVSHSPMRTLVSRLRQSLVLCIGKGKAPCAIARHYGFEQVISAEEWHHHFPDVFPDFRIPHEGDVRPQPPESVAAVLVFNDPLYWGRDLQILCDVARSDGTVSRLSDEQTVELFFAGPDFEYAANFHVPRFGSGAFRFCAEELFRKVTGRELNRTIFGKPELSTYRYVEEQLDLMQTGVDRIYAIGDNPLSDIRGANNAGGRWRSVLVRTGVWNGNQRDLDEHRPHFVCDDVAQALQAILRHEQERTTTSTQH